MRYNTLLTEVNFNREDIRKQLLSLKECKSDGQDGFHPNFLQQTAFLISKPLEISFTKSLIRKPYLKSENLVMLHRYIKKGSKENVANYRPMSITSIICRIMEKIIREKKIVLQMESNSLFTNQQHCFRKGKSCTTQLIVGMEDWTSRIDINDNIDVIYMDFQNAFDSVLHERHLKKLHRYGIQSNLLGWIRNFLTNRKPCVILTGSKSSTAEVTSDIPQGSVLGLAVFIIYINDSLHVVRNTTKLFADDAKLYSVVNNEIEHNDFQNDLKRLDNWSKEWLLKFSPEKCTHVSPNSGQLERCLSTKY